MNTSPAQDWAAILAAAGVPESPGYVEAAAASAAYTTARKARRNLAKSEAARQELERLAAQAASQTRTR